MRGGCRDEDEGGRVEERMQESFRETINGRILARLQLLNGLLRGPNGSLRHCGEDSEKEIQKLLVDNLVSLSVQTMEKLITGKLHQLVA